MDNDKFCNFLFLTLSREFKEVRKVRSEKNNAK